MSSDLAPSRTLKMVKSSALISRAQGSLIGQLAGDALGSLVEFQSPEKIILDYPDGVRLLADGGTWNTIAGQPTDDSEMALLLARMLVRNRTYDSREALKEYEYWLSSDPFDCGDTISAGIQGCPNPQSQANGALMRVSPLGIFGTKFEFREVARWAMQDAALTHPNLICVQVNALFATGIAHAIRSGCSCGELYERIYKWAEDMPVAGVIRDVIHKAAETAPVDYTTQEGWVLIAFQNALYQLIHASSVEEGIVDTIMRGGDADTNAATCGALLGAVWGRDCFPSQWLNVIQSCRPEEGNPKVVHPRPKCFWPTDFLELAEALIS